MSDIREQLWQIIADVRDGAPRRPDDASTDDIVDAIIDSGLLAAEREKARAPFLALADRWEQRANSYEHAEMTDVANELRARAAAIRLAGKAEQ